MSENSNIEWTDATWNPIAGCSVVSPGCTNCYAMKLAGTRLRNHPSRAGLTQDSKAGPIWNGEVRFNEEWLAQPLLWKRPRRIFVCAHGDLFHENVPDEWIDRVFAVIALCRQHTFQILTKRPERMRDYMLQIVNEERGFLRHFKSLLSPMVRHNGDSEGVTRARLDDAFNAACMGITSGGADRSPQHNVWLGVSVEDQKRADERIPLLLQTPAAIRFISAEPLLAGLDLTRITLIEKAGSGPNVTIDALRGWYGGADEGKSRIGWVIAGGESGKGARPMHIDWARSLRDQCISAGTAFHFKQFGEYKPSAPVYPEEDRVWQQCWVDEHHPGDKPEDWDLSVVDAFDFMKEFPELGVLYRDGHFYSGEEWQPHVKSGCWWIERVDKKAAGRVLDGRTWDEFPEAA